MRKVDPVAAELSKLRRLFASRPDGDYATQLSDSVRRVASSFRKAKVVDRSCECLAPLLVQIQASAKESVRLVALDVLGGLFYQVGDEYQTQLMRCLFSALERDLKANSLEYLPLAYLLSANYPGISDRLQRQRLVKILGQLQKRHSLYENAAFVTDLVRIYKKAGLAKLERQVEEAFSSR
jgi:hypothetical protein